MKGDFSRLSFDRTQAFTRVLMQQGRVQLDSDWNEKQEMDLYAARAALRDVAAVSGVAAGTTGFAIGVTPAGNDLTVAPGRLYASGILCETTAGTSLSMQPFLAPAPPPAVAAETRYLVYLDVWERDVSALEQPALRETALGGPDTATRTRLIWQVRLQPTDPHNGSENFPPGWVPDALAGPPGQMLASTAPANPATGPCVLPPGASYTSLSNQLYRVEIHAGGSFGTAGSGAPSFKWSRENASVATTVIGVQGQTLTVADLGPDDRLSFQPGRVVELADAWMDLASHAGTLLLIDSVNPQASTITIAAATPVPAFDPTVPVLLRRWDQPGTAGSATQAAPVAAGPLPLEAGIQVSFAPGFYASGQYWTVPARTAIDSDTGNIVWPAPGTPLPPQGPVHSYVPLALVDYIPPATGNSPAPGKFIIVEDCRALFSPAAGRLAPMHARYAQGGRQTPLPNGHAIRLDVLGQGLMVTTPVPLDSSSVTAGSVQLVAELPMTMSQVVPGSTDNRVAGSQRLVLSSSMSMPTQNRIVVTPSQPAQDLLAAALARRINTGTTDLSRLFSTADFAPSPASYATWVIQGDGSVAQTKPNVAWGPNGIYTPLTPCLALSTTVVANPTSHAGVSYTAGSATGDAGIVFNWLSNADFWVFYNSLYWQVAAYEGASPFMTSFVQHIVNGQVASTVQGMAGQCGRSAHRRPAGVEQRSRHRYQRQRPGVPRGAALDGWKNAVVPDHADSGCRRLPRFVHHRNPAGADGARQGRPGVHPPAMDRYLRQPGEHPARRRHRAHPGAPDRQALAAAHRRRIAGHDPRRAGAATAAGSRLRNQLLCHAGYRRLLRLWLCQRAWPGGGSVMRQGKQSFSEKKDQKTFASCWRRHPWSWEAAMMPPAKAQKFFVSFFRKRSACLAFLHPA